MDLLRAYSDGDEGDSTDADTKPQSQSQHASRQPPTNTKSIPAPPSSSFSSSSSSFLRPNLMPSPTPSPSPPTSFATSATSGTLVKRVNAAPSVDLDLKAGQNFLSPTTTVLYHNPTAEAMWQPPVGPVDPSNPNTVARNIVTGFIEESSMNDAVFAEQYHTFMAYGYAANPTESGLSAHANKPLVGGPQAQAIQQHDAPTVFDSKRKPLLDTDGQKRKRTKDRISDPQEVDKFTGPWAARFEDELAPTEAPELTDEQKEYIASQEDKKKKQKKEDFVFEESTIFHGKEEKDYQGRSFLHPPENASKIAAEKCFIPKKWLHTWAGHTKGVQKIEFLPHTGHLLLSASMDHTLKIWDVQTHKKCLRTYLGHTEAVRDVGFTYDGSRFISASYDRYVKVWDTETGQCLSRHTTRKIPYCLRIHPDKAKQNEFLVGQSDKKIVAWDMRSHETTQTYNEHLGPVNSVNFVDHNRRFVSSSDDKKVFVWEYGIPVVIKHISEPEMHSMPYIAVHPNGKFFVGQSQDNQCLVYSAINRFKLNKKKRFLGHKNAGFACQIGFSPDGRYMMSGDAEGRCFFWDWQTSKVYKKLKCHDQVTIGCVWHPTEPSRVATCSWDGTIKYWD
jgi:pre-mRNA-processing factor 17